MKEIRNCTRRPLRIDLPRGKVLHLNPDAVGQIADEAVDAETIVELRKEGSIEILGEGDTDDTLPDPDGPRQEDTHGHVPSQHQPGHGKR